MSKDDKVDALLKQVEELTANIARLERIDPNSLFTSSRAPRADNDSRPRRPKANEKPDWVKDWARRNASNGPVRVVAKTTDTYHEAEGTVESKTELVQPLVTVEYKRNLATNEVEEVVRTAGLPDHLSLSALHEDRKPTINWAEQPTHDGLVPHGLSNREAMAYLAENPGNPLQLRDEGPIKPVRKQMTRMNKVWKYRNFKKCGICDHYDTWEARTDPYADGPKGVHAEIWCHTCGAVDFEVADNMPAHIGTWAPPKATPKEERLRTARQQYRRERTIFSLVQSPKTPQELTNWFREVEKYEGVDPIMLELMLKRMHAQGLVVRDADGKWWEREDYQFEHTPAGPESK